MPIGTIVGIDSHDYVKKETGELKNATTIHFTYKISKKGMIGLGADYIFLDKERYNIPSLGETYLIEKDKKGFLSNFEQMQPIPKPEGK